jgi:predicted nucleic acid-binding Zn ribbon protein
MDRKPPISECQCHWCGKPMKLWVYSQRFCSRRCGDEFHAAERRQAVEKFRAEGHVVETKRMQAAQG